MISRDYLRDGTEEHDRGLRANPKNEVSRINMLCLHNAPLLQRLKVIAMPI